MLVAEPEPLQALSTRKLVLETGKFNVLTAHSTREAIDLFQLFPNISAAIVASGDSLDCDKISKAIKATTAKVPVIFLTPAIARQSPSADYNIPSHEPEELLKTVRSLFGDPRQLDQAPEV